MKKICIVLLIFFTHCTLSDNFIASGATYYVATNGSDSNIGTITSPWLSWNYAFNRLRPGDILYVRGGNYTGVAGGSGSGSYCGVRIASTATGTSSAPITVSAYQNEVPVLDCTALVSTNAVWTAGIYASVSYWNFIGLSVTNVVEGTNHPANGIANGWFLNGNYLTLTRCNSYHNGGGFAFMGGGNYVYFINCDAYENNDVYDNGGYCNGWSCNVAAGNRIFWEGCRAWSNSDDGYDVYASNAILSFNNCWAFENGHWNGYYGNGSGFKTGKATVQTAGVVRTITNCLSFNNDLIGYDESQDNGVSVTHNVFNNVSYHNVYAFNFGNVGTVSDVMRNNISYDESLGSTGASTGTQNIIDHNSWQNGIVVTSADFESLDATQVRMARKTDGSLPDITFLHLKSTSGLIDKGIDVGLPYSGLVPDLGAFEYVQVVVGSVLIMFNNAIVIW
jgi:hypothetical protein